MMPFWGYGFEHWGYVDNIEVYSMRVPEVIELQLCTSSLRQVNFCALLVQVWVGILF